MPQGSGISCSSEKLGVVVLIEDAVVGDGEPVPYNRIVLRIGKLEFDHGSNVTERVREVTK